MIFLIVVFTIVVSNIIALTLIPEIPVHCLMAVSVLWLQIIKSRAGKLAAKKKITAAKPLKALQKKGLISYLCGMFFILSKTISILILPLSMLTIFLLVFLLARKAWLKKWALGLFVAFFFIFTNPFLPNALMYWWEWPATPIHALDEQYDAAVVLSGITASGKEPLDRVHLHKGADRIMHTVQLYKLGKVKKIILSGGSGLLLEDEQGSSEANEMRKVMLLSGVAAADIWLEENSRNTRENAAFTAELLKEQKLEKAKLLLVTSAFHMNRAMGCFQQAGLAPEPYSTDFYANEPGFTPDELIIPSDGALMTWTRLFREWTGYLVYLLLGYI